MLCYSLKSLTVSTFPHSAIQLMHVIHHYCNKVASACVLLTNLCCQVVRRGAKLITGYVEDDANVDCRGSTEVELYWLEGLLDNSLGNISPLLMSENTDCLLWEVHQLHLGHFSLNHMTGMPTLLLQLPSWEICHPFYFMWFMDKKLFINANNCPENRGAACEAILKTFLHNVNTHDIKLG